MRICCWALPFNPSLIMAKKSAVSKDYIISVEDSGSIQVHRIYDNVKDSLREIAESIGFEYDPKWNTRTLGKNILEFLGKEYQAETGEYIIVRRAQGEQKGKIDTYRTYANSKGALREVANAVGFEFDPNWTVRQLGNKLVDFLNGK